MQGHSVKSENGIRTLHRWRARWKTYIRLTYVPINTAPYVLFKDGSSGNKANGSLVVAGLEVGFPGAKDILDGDIAHV